MKSSFFAILAGLFMAGISSCVGSRIKYLQKVEERSALGPYSVATIWDRFVFTSGQLGLVQLQEPGTGTGQSGGQLAEGIESQTRPIMTNLQAILEKSGSDLNHVVHTTIYLKDIQDYALVNKVYGSFFKQYKPARTTVEMARLPQNALIEIACIAIR